MTGRRLATVVVATGLVILGAGRVRAAGMVEGTFAIGFDGTSTLHGFSGTASAQPFRAESTVASDGVERWRADLSVPIAALSTGNSRRDRNMRAMLGVPHHRVVSVTIRDVATDWQPRPIDDPAARGTLPFMLTIGDVTHALRGTVSKWRQTDERHASFDVDFVVSLEAFELDAPSVLGVIRVGDRVDVHVAVTVMRR